MNTRRYARTLAEAFPCSTLYACAVERPAPRYPRLLWLVMALGFFVAILTVRTS